jgi:hypothetical protein
MGGRSSLAPFLARPPYRPEGVPPGPPAQCPPPAPPLGVRGLEHFPTLARIAHRLNITARELDQRLTVSDCLDEADLAVYLSAVDACAMPAPPKAPPGR